MGSDTIHGSIGPDGSTVEVSDHQAGRAQKSPRNTHGRSMPLKGQSMGKIVRKSFPQVYELEHPRMVSRYWLVSARSTKWGMNERKTFNNEDDALDYARQIEQQLVNNGKGPELPTEKLQAAKSYEDLVAKLASHGRTPEEATAHFLIRGCGGLKATRPKMSQ